MNTYECMVLLDNREVKQGWEPLKQAVTGLFEKCDAEILSARHWSERRLAYPIKGQIRGTYLLVYYKGDPERNTPLRRELELSETVLRYMISTCEEIPAEAYEPEAEVDVSAIPEPGEEAAEAEASDESNAEPEAKGEAKAEAKGEAKESGDAPAEGEAPAETEAPAEGEASTNAEAGAGEAAAAEASAETAESSEEKS